MALFGNKKDKKLDLPEVVDFSNDTWSFKGNPPQYQIQSDGFTYDVVDADGNDKNAITLGLSGMLVIVLNAKGPKIKEDELLPHLSKVIKTRNWHSMTVKEANFLVQTAIKKLTNSATSGDVFDLASYAPLEVKRVLLKVLFTISRVQLPPEFREEAEHRIIDDIVPDIFANPDYELALLTGLIVKPDEKAAEQPVFSKIETSPIIESNLDFNNFVSAGKAEVPLAPTIPEPEPDSAFAELQKIYGRRVDSPEVQSVSNQNRTEPEPVSGNDPNTEAPKVSSETPAQPEPVSNNSLPVNPFTVGEPTSGLNQVSSFNNIPQPNNPFGAAEPKSIPQPAAPNFFGAQPNSPFNNMNSPAPFPNMQQRIPQPPVPGYGMQQPNYPYNNQGNPQMPQMPYPGYQQPMNPYMANQQMYPPQMRPQGQMPGQGAPAAGNNPQLNGQSQFPQQGNQQNMPGYPQNPNFGGNNPQGYPNWPNPAQNYPQQPNQNPNSNS